MTRWQRPLSHSSPWVCGAHWLHQPACLLTTDQYTPPPVTWHLPDLPLDPATTPHCELWDSGGKVVPGCIVRLSSASAYSTSHLQPGWGTGVQYSTVQTGHQPARHRALAPQLVIIYWRYQYFDNINVLTIPIYWRGRLRYMRYEIHQSFISSFIIFDKFMQNSLNFMIPIFFYFTLFSCLCLYYTIYYL